MVNHERLIEPQDDFKDSFPKINFRDIYHFRTFGEPILVTDPIYLANVYNSQDDIASFLQAHGVIVMDFGGGSSGPVWWQSPFVLLPISSHYENEPQPIPNIEELAAEVGTDSGSFIFLPLTNDLPKLLQEEVKQVLADDNGASLQLPAGEWSVLYEQWEPTQTNMTACFRNIVLEWKAQ